MSTKVWLGGAAEVAQVDKVTIPEDVEGGMIFTFTIGYKTWSYTVGAGESRNDVVDGIVAGWNRVTKYEFAEITAAVDYITVEDEYEGTETEEYSGKVRFTAKTPGKPFIFTVSIGTSTNEKQYVTIGNSPTGGTFTLTFDGETTDPLDYDATAAEVQAELVGLSNIGADNVVVTGEDGGAGKYAGLKKVNLDGAIQQIAISRDTNSGMITTLSRLREVDTTVPEFDERQRNQALREMVKQHKQTVNKTQQVDPKGK
ncbi:hypothetical protein [Gimesia sp.]|uniref:hypothetical protein n=1 Tax=Gimesia sp. TaxID=2024833 RepID=UPI003A8D4E7D